mgnify:CR=1
MAVTHSIEQTVRGQVVEMLRIRKVLQEFEASLTPTSGSLQTKARGKAEWKTCENGTRQCKLSLSRLDLADGAMLELVVAGRRIRPRRRTGERRVA